MDPEAANRNVIGAKGRRTGTAGRKGRAVKGRNTGAVAPVGLRKAGTSSVIKGQGIGICSRTWKAVRGCFAAGNLGGTTEAWPFVPWGTEGFLFLAMTMARGGRQVEREQNRRAQGRIRR